MQEMNIEICRQAEEIERNRVHEETMQILLEMIKKQEEKRVIEEAARQEQQEVKIIAKPEAKHQNRITPCLKNFRVITKESIIPSNNTPQVSPDELIKSSVKNLVPIPRESEDVECDLPVNDEPSLISTTFSNPLFDSNDDFSSSDDESLSNDDIPNEIFKIYSNPLVDEEIIFPKIDLHSLNTESSLIDSMLKSDILIDSSLKFDFLLEEFSGKLAPSYPIPLGIIDNDFEREEEFCLNKNVLYENSSLEERNAEIPNISVESPSPLPVADNVAALTTEVSELKNMMKTMLIYKQKAQAPASVKAVEQSCVTCGGTIFNQNRGSNFNQGQVYQPPTYQPPVYQAPTPQPQGVSKTDFENYVKANDVVLRNMQNQGQGLQNQMINITEMLSKFITSNTALSSNSGTLLSQTVTNPREHVNAITTRSGKTSEGPSIPLVPTPVVSTPLKEPEQNPETSMDKVQKPSSESTTQVPPSEDHDSIFIEIPKPRAKKTVQEPDLYQPKLPYPERMKVREKDTPSAQQSRFMKLFKQLCLEIGLKDALIEMPKFNTWLRTLLRNKEKLEEIAITTVNAECPTIILNKVPKKLEDPRKFLIPCALQELDRTNALADSRASTNLLPHSIYKQLGLGALKPTRMILELANRSVTHPMGIAEDVVVRVDGFTFLADFVVVNFEPDPRVPIILGRPFLRTAKALIDLYEEKLTLRVGSDELVFYAEKSEKSKNKQFAHAISIIDFSKDEPFSGSTTFHSDALPPSSSPVKTSDNLEEFADELTLLKEGMVEDVKNENFNVSNSDEPVLLNTPLSDKVECSDPEDDIDEIDAFLAMEVSSNFEEGYFDSEGDVIFLENLLSDDTTHNLASEVIPDHEPKQNESIHDTSITFSPRNDPLHHEFAGELLTLPSRIVREHEEYLSLMIVLCEISTSRSQENVHVNPYSIIESLPASLIPVEDSDPVQEEIDIFLIPHDLIPPGVENDDSADEDNSTFLPENESSILEPSSPRPPPEPPDVCLNFKPDTAMKIDEDFNQIEIVVSLNVEDVNSFTFVIWTFLPSFT
ncbi:reverse transcriptase domain-containing protein [Tanacetum coccineum]